MSRCARLDPHVPHDECEGFTWREVIATRPELTELTTEAEIESYLASVR